MLVQEFVDCFANLPSYRRAEAFATREERVVLSLRNPEFHSALAALIHRDVSIRNVSRNVNTINMLLELVSYRPALRAAALPSPSAQKVLPM